MARAALLERMLFAARTMYRAFDRQITASSPFTLLMRCTSACSGVTASSDSSSVSGLGLHHPLTVSYGPFALSSVWAAPTTRNLTGGTLSGCLVESTNSHHAASTPIVVVFPFCRATRTMTRRNRYEPSGLSSSAWTSSQHCHGYRRTCSTIVANAITAYPLLVVLSRERRGGVYRRGTVTP